MHSVVTNLSSITLSHLALGVAYSVRVAARSALGQGQFSAVQEGSTLNGEEVYLRISLVVMIGTHLKRVLHSWRLHGR